MGNAEPEQIFLPVIEQVTRADLTASDALTEQVLWFLEKGFGESPALPDDNTACMTSVANDMAQIHIITLGTQMVGAFATFIENEKQGLALHVWCVGGEHMEGWLGEFLCYLDGFAQQTGCGSVKFGGRVGWQRLLSDKGYKTEAVMMRKMQ